LVCFALYSKNPTLYNTNSDEEEGNLFPDTPPREPSPPPTSLEFSVEEAQNYPLGESDTLTSSEATLSTFAEKGLHALDTASISSPAPHMVGAQIAAGEHKVTNSFDIFDSDDHDTLGNGRRHSINSLDGSTFIGNGLASPKRCCVSPPLDGHLVTPAPKKIASLLTPPPSGEKTSITSVSPQEVAPDVSPFEKENIFTLPHEEDPNGDFRDLEQGDSSPLSHAQNHSDDVALVKENGHSSLPHEENRNGDVHTLEDNNISTLSHETDHTGDVTPFEENGCSTLPHENCDGNVHTLEQGEPSIPPHEENNSGNVTKFEENDYSTLPHENYVGDVHTLEQGDPSIPPHEENNSGNVTKFEENDYSTLPHENCDGDVHTREQSDYSALSLEGNRNGDVAQFGENGYSTFPHETYESNVHALEPTDLPTFPHEENRRGDATPFEENHHFTLPHEENHYDDTHSPEKAPCEPYGASEITNIKEQNSGRQPRGDYWRPSVTDSRTHPRYRDSYRHRETGGSNHQFGSSGRHLSDSNSGGGERGRRDRSRSPARDIKRGRFRDPPPSHRSLPSHDGLHGLSGSNASHQTEDKGGWHRFGSHIFKGDRYIPTPEPTRPAYRSPAPSPGRELTPPRRTPRNPSRSRLPAQTLPERRSSRQSEYTHSKAHPTRSSGALPDQSIAFQNSIRSANTIRHHGAGSAFEGGHSADMRNSNYAQARIPTSPKRPEKRRRYEDEPPVQNKRSRRDEPAYNGGRGRDYRTPRPYGSR